MSEQKSQSQSVPLRVRFRPAAERLQGGLSPALDSQALQLPTLELTAEIEHESRRRAQQIKELIHLGNLLRADMDLDEVLQQIVTSISVCTGFRILVINLVEEGSDYVVPVAFAGASPEGERIVRESRMTVKQLLGLISPEFRISQSYFISHEHTYVYGEIVRATDKTIEDYAPGGWHPEDSLLVPLFSPRDRKKLLGFLSLDDPEDGKVPTLESIEVVELFANQAEIAIDNARFFQEREAERLALEEAIIVLRRDLERIQQGDLRVRVRSSHEKLQPVAYAINAMVSEISEIIGDVQMVTLAVDEHATEVQQSSNVLVQDASQQEQQVQGISQVTDEMAATMHSISERAGKISQVAVEAMDVTLEGQSAVDRAVDGMGQVREVTMQSARVMKRLGESGQEINDTILTISDLTARMNLLALNAAIEAARAGEQGQGFALIAQEIRTLAVHSADAARKVAARIRTIQQETATVALSVEQNTRQVVMQTELVTQTGVALEAISVVTEQMANLVQDICTAAESQAQGTQLIARSVEGISRMTSEITRHMRQMQQSLASLVELTNSLRSRVTVFRIGASDLHHSGEKERRSGDTPHG
jgi:methyl-accepting chemotaxis protein